MTPPPHTIIHGWQAPEQQCNGDLVVPLCVAGGFCVLGAATYLFVVGPLAPLPSLPPRAGPTARTIPAGRA